MKSKDDKIKETLCLCEIHIRIEAERKSTIPCLGHGKGCICTERIENDKAK